MKEIEKRRTTRKFKQDKVPDTIIKEVIEQAMLAPSGSNTQPWEYLVINDKELIKKIAILNNNQKWIEDVPTIIVSIANGLIRFTDRNTDFSDDISDPGAKKIIRDTSISTSFLVLEAQSKGLASAWLSWYEQDKIKECLNLPCYTYVVGIVAIGYSDERPVQRPRKSFEDVVHFDEYKDKGNIDPSKTKLDLAQ